MSRDIETTVINDALKSGKTDIDALTSKEVNFARGSEESPRFVATERPYGEVNLLRYDRVQSSPTDGRQLDFVSTWGADFDNRRCDEDQVGTLDAPTVGSPTLDESSEPLGKESPFAQQRYAITRLLPNVHFSMVEVRHNLQQASFNWTDLPEMRHIDYTDLIEKVLSASFQRYVPRT